MGYLKYITIFKTNLIQSPTKSFEIISDPVKIEFVFNEARSYKVSSQILRIVPKGEESIFAKSKILELENNKTYIILIARTKEKNPTIAREHCEKEIDMIITTLSCIFSSNIFYELDYRGWLLEKEGAVALDAWIKLCNKINLGVRFLLKSKISFMKF